MIAGAGPRSGGPARAAAAGAGAAPAGARTVPAGAGTAPAVPVRAAVRAAALRAATEPADIAAVELQLGRVPRGVMAVAHRCPCGLPDVIETAPRLPDGTPFPTLYYLTCPRACAAVSRLEAGGTMRTMTERLAADPGLRRDQLAAHRDYLARREAAGRAAGTDPLPAAAASAGGMPDRVKCLHALVAHELAAAGSNRLGREALLAAGPWWQGGRCVASPGAGPALRGRGPQQYGSARRISPPGVG